MDEENEVEVEEYVGNSLQNGKNIALKRFEFMMKETLTYEDYVWAVGFMNDIKLKEGLPDDNEKNWQSYAVDFAEKFKHASIAEINNFLSNPVTAQEFKADFTIAFSKMMKNFTPQMREGFWAWRKPDYMDYEFLSSKFWTQNVEEGQSMVILGQRGSGKSDFAMLEAQHFIDGRFIVKDGEKYEENRRIATNIAIVKEKAETELQKEYVSRIDYYSKFSDLMLLILNNIIHGIKTLNIGDEMTVGGFRKKTAMGKTSLNMDMYERLTRKLGAANIYIWHLDTEIPTEIYQIVSMTARKYGSTTNPSGRKLGTFEFTKGSRKKVMYHVKGIPGTIIPFKTRDIAPFTIDIPMQTMIEKLAVADRESMDDIDLFKQLRIEVMKLQEEAKKKHKNGDDE